ncbi:hypothetical protein BSKO_03574 [Bryopsis sp. KO-2023]|nr:hypothetical protein BSKO_03574 [Bryopsis sp. KO-2023]
MSSRPNTSRRKLSEKQQDLIDTHKKLEELEGDFRYNLSLLDQRDAELQEYDRVFAALNVRLEDKDHALSQLNVGLAEANSELKIERDKNQELEETFDRQRVSLEKALEEERLRKEETILRKKEEWEAQKRQLQRGLAEADGEIERQRRELSGGFSVELHALEIKYQQRAEEAIAAMAQAENSAEQSVKEMRTALEREKKQADLAQAAIGKMREKEELAESLTWELENMKRLKDDQILTLEGRCKIMDQHRKEAERRVAEALEELSQVKNLMEQERGGQQNAFQNLETQFREDTNAMKTQLQQAEARVSELLTEREELLVEAASKRSELQVEVSHIKEAHEREMLEMVQQFERTAKQRTAEMRELQERNWLRETELQASREKMKIQKATLEEGKHMLDDYKSKMVSAGEHTRELQRRVVQLELQLEVQLEEREAAVRAEVEGTLKKLTAQRDAANVAVEASNSQAEEITSMQAHMDALTKELLEVRAAQTTQAQQHTYVSSPRLSEISEIPTPPELDQAQFAASITSETPHVEDEARDHQNETDRLKSVISAMRHELETLQESSVKRGGADVGPILAELNASDDDLRQALEHVEILQSQAKRSASMGDAKSQPEELQYLRAKVKELRMENRRLRRCMMEIEIAQSKDNQGFTEGADIKENGDPNVAQPDLHPCSVDGENESLEAETEHLRSRVTSLEEQLKDSQSQREEAGDLKRQLEDLIEENDRLMELGNALRSERDRALIASAEGHALHWEDQSTRPIITPAAPSIATQSWPPKSHAPQNDGGIWWGPENRSTHPQQQPIHQHRPDPLQQPQLVDLNSSSPQNVVEVRTIAHTPSAAPNLQENSCAQESGRRSPVAEPMVDSSPDRGGNCEGGEESRGGTGSSGMNVHAVKGNKCGGRQERIGHVPKSVSDRSTPSQRAKLKVLQKRNEQRNVPRKVRNYSVKDEEEGVTG